MSNTITQYHTTTGTELEIESSMGVFYIYYTTAKTTDDEVIFYDENENQVFYSCDEDFATAFQNRIVN